MVDECVESFVWGCVGGILAEFLKWYRIRETLHKEAPGYAKSLFYWILTFAGIMIGGVCVLVYKRYGIEMNILLSIQIGGSSMLLLDKLFASTPRIDKGEIK
jgi:hypothetical protein